MFKRLGFSVLVGIATALVVLIAGGLISLIPGIAPFGAWLVSVCVPAGFLGAIVFFVFGRSFWS